MNENALINILLLLGVFLVSAVFVGLLVIITDFYSERDKAIFTQAQAYEDCLIVEYGMTVQTARQSFGYYPPCD